MHKIGLNLALFSLCTGLLSQVPVNDDCIDAFPIVCGELLSGSLEFAEFSIDGDDCFNGFQDVWFQITGDGSIHSFISLNDNDIRFDLRLENCNSDYPNCLNSYSFNSSNDSISFLLLSNVEYHIRLSAYYFSNDYKYDIQHTCRSSLSNDSCDDPEAIECGQLVTGNTALATSTYENAICIDNSNDLWYVIEGDDMFHTFQFISSESQIININVFDHNCTPDNYCIEQFTLFQYSRKGTFYAPIGSSYVLNISIRNHHLESGEFSFSHTCHIPETNDACDNPALISCGEKLEGNTLYASYDNSHIGCSNDSYNDVWFSITGDDMIHVFSIDSLETSELILEIYESSCAVGFTQCRELIFHEHRDNVPTSFFAENGVQYHFRASTGYNHLGYFALKHNCYVPPPNDECESPIIINCGDQIIGSSLIATESAEPRCRYGNHNDLWFLIEGDGMVHSFQQDSSHIVSGTSLKFDIFSTSNCQNLINSCYKSIEFRHLNTYFIQTEIGVDYLIRVIDYSNLGYTINHDCLAPLANDLCENAISISCNDLIEGVTYGTTGSLGANDCGLDDISDIWYILEGDDMLHVFELLNPDTNGYNPIIIEFTSYDCPAIERNCETFSYLDNFTNTTSFFAQAGEVYYIRIGSKCCDQYNNFQIQHYCVEMLDNDFCINADELMCGETYQGDLIYATYENIHNGCDHENRRDLWYSLSGDDLFYNFTLSENMAIDIYQGVCGQNDLECLGTWFFPNEITEYSIFAEENEPYLLRLYTYHTETNFSFDIECLPKSSNDTCLNAQSINCPQSLTGDIFTSTASGINNECILSNKRDLWYKIAGDGMLHSFSYAAEYGEELFLYVYEHDCGLITDNDINCPQQFLFYESDSIFEIFLDEGVEYLIRITENYSGENFDFTIDHNCRELLPNDLCENPIQISCQNEIIEGNTSTATFSGNFNGCYTERTQDLWYDIVGDGKIHTLTYDSSDHFSFKIDLFTSTCNEFGSNCQNQITLSQNNNPYSFLAEDGISYLMRIYFDCCQQNGFFKFRHSCINVAENDSCDEHLFINCDQNITGDLAQATTNSYQNNCSAERRDLWYAVEGDGQLHQFSNQTNQNNLLLELYTTQCRVESNICPQQFELNFHPISFVAEEGTTYFLRIFSTYYEQKSTFEIEHDCMTPHPNDFCQDAQALSCGEQILFSSPKATFSNNNPFCEFSGWEDLWYVIDGDDMVHQFEFLLSEDSRIYFEIFENTCDPKLAFCNQSFNLYSLDISKSLFLEFGTKYYLRVYSLDGTKKFVFKHSCLKPAINNNCGNAIILECPNQINIDFSNATSSETPLSCASNDYQDLWFKFTGDGLMHSFMPIQHRRQLTIINIFKDSCPTDSSVNCEQIALSDDIKSYYFEEGIEYFLQIARFKMYDTEIEIIHNCESIAKNNICSNAFSVSCHENIYGNTLLATATEEFDGCDIDDTRSLWYHVQGDGKIHNFQYISSSPQSSFFININRGDCQDFIECNTINPLSGRRKDFSFFANEGEDYYASIYFLENDGIGEFELSHSCNDVVFNDICEQAIELSCDSLLFPEIYLATSSEETVSCVNSQRKDVWYSIEGDGFYHEFKLRASEGNTRTEFDIYTGECNNLNCTSSFILNNNGDVNGFFAENDFQYFVRVQSLLPYAIEQIEYYCIASALNDECSESIPIACGESYSFTIFGATPDNEYTTCGFTSFKPGIWFQFEGSDEYIEINTSATDFRVDAFIYEGTCETIGNCLTNEKIFFAESNKTYSILLKAEPYNEQMTIEFNINCFAREMNDTCDSAHLLTCGETVEADAIHSSRTIEFSYCENTNCGDLWYEITGDGNYHAIRIIDGETFSYYIYLATDTCDNQFSDCQLLYIQDAYQLLTDMGQTYYLAIVPYCENNYTPTFTMEYSCSAPESNDNCIDAIPIACGDLFQGNLLFGSSSFFQNECASDKKNDLWYSLIGDGSTLRFLLDSIDNHNDLIKLHIFQNDCTQLDNCILSQTLSVNQFINFQTQQNVDYIIRISGMDGQFFGRVECIESITNDNCENPIPLFCGEDLTGDLFNATSSFLIQECQGNTSFDMWFSLAGDGMYHQFFQSNDQSIVQLNVFDNTCPINQMDCGMDFLISDILDRPTNAFFAENGVEYFVRVSMSCCFSENPLFFDLKHLCFDEPENDICDGAQALDCAEKVIVNTVIASQEDIPGGCYGFNRNDLWYHIEGDNMMHIIRLLSSTTDNGTIEIYEEDCPNSFVMCEGMINLIENNTTSFLAEIGKNYFLRIHSGLSDLFGYMEFSHECVSVARNDRCAQAINLSCSDDLSLDFLTATNSEACSNCGNEENPDLWFSIIGDGLIHRFENTGLSASNFVVEIYQGDCGEFYECHDQWQFGSLTHAASFFFEEGVHYLLRFIDGNLQFNSVIPIDHSCAAANENDSCSEAIEIYCDETVTLNTTNASLDHPDLCYFRHQDNPGLYYSMQGQNSNITFRFISGDFIPYVQVQSGNCDESACVSSQNYFNNLENYFYVSFNTQQDSTYIIYISGHNEIEYGELTFEVLCTPLAENISCDQAESIHCNLPIYGSTLHLANNTNIDMCTDIISDSPGIWYDFTGTGDTMSIDLSEFTFTPFIYIYENDCDNLKCLTLDQNLEHESLGLNTCGSSEDFSISIPCLQFDTDLQASICAPIIFNNYNQLRSFEIEVVYDQNILNFSSATASTTNGRISHSQMDGLIEMGISPIFIEQNIESDTDTLFRICFDPITPDNETSSALYFKDLPIAIDTFNSLVRDFCLDPGIIYLNNPSMQCADNIILNIPSEQDAEYKILIAGKEKYDSGTFTINQQCEIVNEIPTLSDWALIWLSLLLLIFGVIHIKSPQTALSSKEY